MPDFQVYFFSFFRTVQYWWHHRYDGTILHINRNLIKTGSYRNYLSAADVFTCIEIIPFALWQYYFPGLLAGKQGSHQQIFSSHVLILDFFCCCFSIWIFFQVAAAVFFLYLLFKSGLKR